MCVRKYLCLQTFVVCACPYPSALYLCVCLHMHMFVCDCKFAYIGMYLHLHPLSVLNHRVDYSDTGLDYSDTAHECIQAYNVHVLV